MTSPTNHAVVRELLPAAALSALEDGEMQEVLSHAATCEECSRALSEYHDVVVALDAAIPPRDRDEHTARAVRQRLLLRARAEAASGRGSRRGFWNSADRWAGWAVAAGFAGTILVHHSFHRPVDYGWLVAGVLMVALVGLAVYARVHARRAAAPRDRLSRG